MIASDMGTTTDYFERIGYRPTWHIGDRVKGRWNSIPFRGTVGNDTMISETEGPRVSVHVDLPIQYRDKVYTVIFLRPQELEKFL